MKMDNELIITLLIIIVILLLLLVALLKSRRRKIDLIHNLHELSDKLIKKGEELEVTNNALTDLNEEIAQQKEEIASQAESLQESLARQRELNEFKEGLTSMIVHDLKNPLNLVLNRAKDKEVVESGRQMLNMINNILDVQKYESTKMPVSKSQFALTELIVNAINKVNFLINQKGISINNYVDKCIVFADKELLDRVLVNLLSNAIKYTPTQGKIEIYSKLIDKSEIKIYVKDNGPGIPEMLKDRVFDKFMQIIAKKSGETRSYGLGLTFCKLAIEAHAKVIGVDTEVGKGTSFWFTLECLNNSTYEKNEIEIKQSEPAANLNFISEDLLSIIIPYINMLKKLDVYEVSEIQKVIEQLNELKIPEIENWLKAIENAAYSVNQHEYQQLIAQFLN